MSATYDVEVPCVLCQDGGTVKARVTLTGRSLSLTGRAVLGKRTCSHDMGPLSASLTRGRAIDVAAALHTEVGETKIPQG
jgi:hypothetical protein